MCSDGRAGGGKKRKYTGFDSRLEFVKKYLLETDLSEENWTRLPFKDDMLIHVKKAFSQEDRAGEKAPVLYAYGLICTYLQDITAK